MFVFRVHDILEKENDYSKTYDNFETQIFGSNIVNQQIFLTTGMSIYKIDIIYLYFAIYLFFPESW